MTPEEIRRKINELPKGGVTIKRSNGRAYAYYQWTENGKQKGRRISDEEYQLLNRQIQKRKQYEKELRDSIVYNFEEPDYKTPLVADARLFRTDVRIGESLALFAQPVQNYKRRSIFPQIKQFIDGDSHDKVFILYGLRRTGKTTLIRQVILDMNDEQQKRTAFIQITPKDSLAELNKDLKDLEALGIKYVFIDEVTIMEDFIQGAALFSDIYAASGLKIVLSGTDSLGFVFTEDEQLYDRCVFLHTTFIPYSEFQDVLGISGIDNYIQFGGTMSKSGENYNRAIFGSKQSTEEYVDSAIAHNIQHSLKYYQYGGHFRHLHELYESNELTNVINRIVEDMNNQFTLNVLTRDFKSHDLGASKTALRNDRTSPTTVLDDIDTEFVTQKLKEFLEIRNKNEQTVPITDAHRIEIHEYLELLDLINNIDIINLEDLNDKQSLTVFTQPGLRYSQVQALIKALLLDASFASVSIQERARITERILSVVKGRMMENIVLLETKLTHPEKQVFKLQFAVGEFDMVVADQESLTCEIYEIKYSDKCSPEQTRHLRDEQKCARTEFRFGTITGKYVIYRGETKDKDGIKYINVEDFLTK